MKTTNYTDPTRSKYYGILNRVLGDESMSRSVERGIFNHILQECDQKKITKKWDNPYFRNLYIAKVRSVYSNLKGDSYIGNEGFKERLVSGEFSATEVAKLSAYDVYPDNWRELFDLKTKRDKLKHELKPEAMTDVFKCSRCESRSCSYYEVQTRSADEPMTQFINCLECGNRWKQ
jgi:transcription elongation factor S-II